MTRVAPVPTSDRTIDRRVTPPIDPVMLAVVVASAHLEVRAGRRAPDQLHPVLSPTARRRQRAVVVRRRQERVLAGGVTVSRVVTCHLDDDAVEVVVVARTGDRVVPVAVRVDRRRGRWWVTDVGVPEDREPLGVRRRDTS